METCAGQKNQTETGTLSDILLEQQNVGHVKEKEKSYTFQVLIAALI